MITFHRAMFVAVLAICLIQGALNEGRKDLLNQLMTNQLISSSLPELLQLPTKG